MKKNKCSSKDDLTYLDNCDDQYKEILDNLEINESTDSETTNIENFRVINKRNPYPLK
ncbi:hypothetical protein [Romboutsia lituseburensis]|uniref:hypothetical protein n=1 Tax=Romboutsia lituseburensis TaxID=1537 RepID=UPI0022EA5CD4|nr:hypothetical protein [Romboutsia lituseburensis]